MKPIAIVYWSTTDRCERCSSQVSTLWEYGEQLTGTEIRNIRVCYDCKGDLDAAPLGTDVAKFLGDSIK